MTSPATAVTTTAMVRVAQGTGFARLTPVLDLLMIVSMPLKGGHHLVDAVGGLTVTIAAIFTARLVLRGVEAQATPVAPAPVARAGRVHCDLREGNAVHRRAPRMCH